jgi:hypothetical protein
MFQIWKEDDLNWLGPSLPTFGCDGPDKVAMEKPPGEFLETPFSAVLFHHRLGGLFDGFPIVENQRIFDKFQDLRL